MPNCFRIAPALRQATVSAKARSPSPRPGAGDDLSREVVEYVSKGIDDHERRDYRPVRHGDARRPHPALHGPARSKELPHGRARPLRRRFLPRRACLHSNRPRMPSRAVGRARWSPKARSNMTAVGTMGTRVTPTSKPMFLSSRYLMTPPAASRPKALPPDRNIPWTSSTTWATPRASTCLVPAALPLTSIPQVAPLSKRMTVQPVQPSKSEAWPTRMPSMSVMALSMAPAL